MRGAASGAVASACVAGVAAGAGCVAAVWAAAVRGADDAAAASAMTAAHLVDVDRRLRAMRTVSPWSEGQTASRL